MAEGTGQYNARHLRYFGRGGLWVFDIQEFRKEIVPALIFFHGSLVCILGPLYVPHCLRDRFFPHLSPVRLVARSENRYMSHYRALSH